MRLVRFGSEMMMQSKLHLSERINRGGTIYSLRRCRTSGRVNCASVLPVNDLLGPPLSSDKYVLTNKHIKTINLLFILPLSFHVVLASCDEWRQAWSPGHLFICRFARDAELTQVLKAFCRGESLCVMEWSRITILQSLWNDDHFIPIYEVGRPTLFELWVMLDSAGWHFTLASYCISYIELSLAVVCFP